MSKIGLYLLSILITATTCQLISTDIYNNIECDYYTACKETSNSCIDSVLHSNSRKNVLDCITNKITCYNNGYINNTCNMIENYLEIIDLSATDDINLYFNSSYFIDCVKEVTRLNNKTSYVYNFKPWEICNSPVSTQIELIISGSNSTWINILQNDTMYFDIKRIMYEELLKIYNVNSIFIHHIYIGSLHVEVNIFSHNSEIVNNYAALSTLHNNNFIAKLNVIYKLNNGSGELELITIINNDNKPIPLDRSEQKCGAICIALIIIGSIVGIIFVTMVFYQYARFNKKRNEPAT